MNDNKLQKKLVKFFMYFCLWAFALSIIVPLGWAFLASLKHKTEFYGNPWALPKGLYLENFRKAFVEANMGEYFLNSVCITALALIILLLVSIPAAYVLARFEFKGKKIVSGLFTAGLFVNVNYIVVPIFLLILDGEKFIKNVFAIPLSVTVFLDSRIVVSIVYAATSIPFTVYLLINYFRTLSKSYEEAAYIDGCSKLKTLIHVIIPMAKPSIITVILFNNSINTFTK